MILFLDTETTGVNPKLDRLVQLAWIAATDTGDEVSRSSMIVRPDGFVIPQGAARVHGITTEMAIRSGIPLKQAIEQLTTAGKGVALLVAHNLTYDLGILKGEFHRAGLAYPFASTAGICTMKASTNFCRLPKAGGNSGFKYPKLDELYRHLFGYDFLNAHNAEADTDACMKCFFKLAEVGALNSSLFPKPRPSTDIALDSVSDFDAEFSSNEFDMQASDESDLIVELKRENANLKRKLQKRDQRILDLLGKLDALKEKLAGAKNSSGTIGGNLSTASTPNRHNPPSPNEDVLSKPKQFKSLPIGSKFHRRSNQSVCVKVSNDEFCVGNERFSADIGEWIFVEAVEDDYSGHFL
jgi:DNA polymerase-3 subunit epsilon